MKLPKAEAGDFWGGLAAMLVALPSAIAFGVTIYSPLGASYAAQGALAGILGVTALGLIAPALGGTNRLITAPCAPAAAVLSAFAIVYFRFPFRSLIFWMIFVTLMLPVEVRIGPTYEVVSNLGMLNTYAGLTIPLIASATATFLFRQFFLTVPDELVEAARMDGAGPMRFFWDVLLPLSRTSIAALFVIQFIYGWNQYLWPLLITTDRNLTPIVVGVTQMISRSGDAATAWNLVMATVILAMIPPAVIVVLMQRWFVKGLIETEK